METKPMNDRVIIKRKEAETKTASGFYIPEMAADKPDEGTVVAVGPGKKSPEGIIIPIDLKVGDKVMFTKGAGQSVKVNGENFLVMKEEEIFAVIED